MQIIQLTHKTHTQSMGMVIKAKSGELLVIDGGNTGDADELKRVIAKAGGHVHLWLITHPHDDHYGAVIEALKSEDAPEFDQLGTGMLPDSWAAQDYFYGQLKIWNAFYPTLGNKVFEIRIGQTFQLGSMKVEVLAEANPEIKVNAFNNQSCVFRITEDGFTLIVLGDLGVEAGNKLMQRGIDLSCDALQLAHHGQSAVQENFYQYVKPRIAIWFTPAWLWRNEDAKGNVDKGPFTTRDTIRWMKKLGTRNLTCFLDTMVFDTEDESFTEY